jgi:hypothetical protein
VIGTGPAGWLYGAAGGYLLSLLAARCGWRGRSLALLGAGWTLHGVYLLTRGWISGMFLANPMFDEVFLLPWALALLLLARAGLRGADDLPPLTGLLLLCLLTLMAAAYPKGMATLGPNKLSAWACLYFLTDGLARACFLLGAWLAGAGLLRRSGAAPYHGLLVWGFVLFSVAQVVGAVWCFLGWAQTFQWVYVHLQAAALWLLYAAYIHIRFLPGWRESQRALCALVGGVLIFSFSLQPYLKTLLD